VSQRTDTADLLTCVKRAGGTVRRSRSGHWKVYAGTRLVTVIAGSTGDRRSLRNARAQLRRAGLDIP